MVNTLELTLLS